MLKEIKNSSENNVCVNKILSKNKPDYYIFGVNAYYRNQSSFIDDKNLKENNSDIIIKSEGTLAIENIKREIINKNNIKLLYSVLSFVKNNNMIYDEKNFIRNFNAKNIKTERLENCGNIENYLFVIN